MTFLDIFCAFLTSAGCQVELFIGDGCSPASNLDRKHLSPRAYGVIDAQFEPVI